ncbi:NADPH:adrenodoxin oxidoreductase [Physcia stellaris]|nr:NADPH:adrenodoxin oxidoreductase [Physcia stellaris]
MTHGTLQGDGKEWDMCKCESYSFIEIGERRGRQLTILTVNAVRHGTPRPDSPTLGNPPQYHATKPELISSFPRPPVTNDPRPRPKPEIVNAPSTIFGPGGREAEGGQRLHGLGCGGLEEEHVMLFQDRVFGKKGGDPPPPPPPPPPGPTGKPVAMHGLFLGEGGEEMMDGK